MTTLEFIKAGQQLHGENWKARLAKSLRVSRSTVTKYANQAEDAEVPETLALAINQLRVRKAEELMSVLNFVRG